MNNETIIAVSALLLSLYGIFATNRHNRLSVIPHLVGSRSVGKHNDGWKLSYDLSNHGIGPAKIVSFTLFLDGKPFVAQTNEEPIEALIKATVRDRRKYEIKFHSYPSRGYAILPGQKYQLIEVVVQGTERPHEVFSGSDIRVEYESLYGKRQTFRSNDRVG